MFYNFTVGSTDLVIVSTIYKSSPTKKFFLFFCCCCCCFLLQGYSKRYKTQLLGFQFHFIYTELNLSVMEVCNRSGRKRKLFTVVSAQLSNLYIFAIICMRERFPYFLRVKHLTDPSHLHD